MNLVVQKYGGSSAATTQHIESIAQHIKNTISTGSQVVTVISAMGGQTDALLNLAYEISEQPPRREIDMLLTTGERVSMALLAIALAKIGIDSISLTGSQSGILTDDTHGNARITSILGDRIRHGLKENKVVIVAGFQGVHPGSKEITTLGRGGTDLTAIALSHILKASSCQLYKDVAGIMSADPRLVSNAKQLTKIDWETMSELAWSGADVLHHRGAHLAEKYKIPVEIRLSSKPTHIGTLISGNAQDHKGQKMETPLVSAITHKEKQSLIRINLANKIETSATLAHLISKLWAVGEAPNISRQSINEGESNIELLLSTSMVKEVEDFLEALDSKKSKIIEQQDDLASINIIGSSFKQHPDLIKSISQIIPEQAPAIEIHNKNICIAIAENILSETLNALHQKLLDTK